MEDYRMKRAKDRGQGDSGMFKLSSAFSGKAARLHTLFIFLWFVLPAVYLTTSSEDAPVIFGGSTSAAVEQPSRPFAPAIPGGLSGGSSLDTGMGGVGGSVPAVPAAFPAAAPAPPLAANPAVPPAAPAAAAAEAAPPAAAAAAPPAGGNPAKGLKAPHQREQFWFSVYAEPTKKIMICLAARSTLFPLQDALRRLAHLTPAIEMSVEQRESLVKDSSYKRIAFVRNPSVRAYSVYLSKFKLKDQKSDDYKLFMEHLMGKEWVRSHDVTTMERLTFEKFLSQVKDNGFDGDEVWDSISTICGMDVMKFDYILRTESYEDDATKLLKALGLPRIPPAVFNVTEFKAETEGIGANMPEAVLKKLGDVYQDDYATLGYTREGKDFIRAPSRVDKISFS